MANPTGPETGSAAEWVPVARLNPWGKNPRKNDRAVAGVIASIQEFGFGAPLIARKANGEVIAGHTRLKAAAHLGMTHVPVRYLDLTEAQAHALALADNKLGEAAKWDDALLAVALAEIQASDVEIDVTGFAEHELTKLLADANGTGPVDGESLDTAPEKLQRKWKTALGQLWDVPSQNGRGGGHRLLCGSSTDAANVARLWGDTRADMMWTDPPYGVSYVGKGSDALTIENDAQSPEALRGFLADCFRAADAHALSLGAAWYICHPAVGISLQFRLAVDDVGWVYRQGLVWVKDSMVLGRSDYHYRHEPIIFGYKPGVGRKGRGGDGWHGGNAETSVFEVDRPKVNDLHPTMKPLELVARMVRNSSASGGLVYEPFSGSGTTMLACESVGRRCMAIELDPKYVAVALERMSEVGCHGQLCEA